MPLYDLDRERSGLRAPTSVSRFDVDNIVGIVIHYSTGEELSQPDDRKWWRAIQDYHMGVRGWADIGYAYGIHARRDRILEGRGIGVVQAQSPGWNAKSVSICVMGDDDPGVDDVLPDCRARIVQFVDEVCGYLGRTVPVYGHRETQAPGYTQCPGDELMDWIDAGMPLDKPVEPENKPENKPDKPDPAPPKPPPPSGGVSWTDEIVDNLPQLEPGDTGTDVKRLQGLLAANGSAPTDTKPIDGDYGPATEKAVKAFQKRATPDDVDGVCGRRTWTALLGG